MFEFYAANSPRLFLDEGSCLDIGGMVVDGVDLSPGIAVPDDGDARVFHSVQGFMFTCGPDHIRHPEPLDDVGDGGRDGGGAGRYPLHGSFSASPAKVTRFELGEAMSVAEAQVDLDLACGGQARLYRVWMIDATTGWTSVHDRVENIGATAFAPMLMYHMNIAAKYFDDQVKLSGAMFDGSPLDWTFGDGDMHVFCVSAKEAAMDGMAAVQLGPIAAINGKTLKVRFGAETLPFLQMWRNQEHPAHVLGIEPASHDWKTRAALAEDGAMVLLQPGEARDYELAFSIG